MVNSNGLTFTRGEFSDQLFIDLLHAKIARLKFSKMWCMIPFCVLDTSLMKVYSGCTYLSSQIIIPSGIWTSHYLTLMLLDLSQYNPHNICWGIFGTIETPEFLMHRELYQLSSVVQLQLLQCNPRNTLSPIESTRVEFWKNLSWIATNEILTMFTQK